MTTFQPEGRPLGPVSRAPSRLILEHRRTMHDRPGEHLWVISAAWRVADPAGILISGSEVLMDGESLLMIEGPGCFKCEQPYSRRLARKRCRGGMQDPGPDVGGNSGP